MAETPPPAPTIVVVEEVVEDSPGLHRLTMEDDQKPSPSDGEDEKEIDFGSSRDAE